MRARQVLERWLDAGFDLANHSYSHPSLNRVPLWQFGDEVMKGEVIMRPLVERRGRKFEWFRYPFLHSGMSEEDPSRHHGLSRPTWISRGTGDSRLRGLHVCRSLPQPATRRKRRGWPRKDQGCLPEQVDVGFEYAEKTSIELFGYEMPQILLIHCNELNSLTLRDSISRLRKRGYTFITLDEAMKDPAYERPDTFAGSGGSWLSRTATAMGRQLT